MPTETSDFDDVDEDVSAFISHLTGEEDPHHKDAPAEDDASEVRDDADEAPEADADDASEVAKGDAAAPESTTDAAEAPTEGEIDVLVGGETRKVKLDDLKALYGRQEDVAAAHTAAATKTAAIQQEATRVSAAYTGMIDRAKAKWAPYADLDYIRLGKELDGASWEQLREDAKAAYDDVQYLEQAAQQHGAAVHQQALQANQAAAKATLAELSGPVDRGGIEGFGKEVYDKIVAFAVRSGISESSAKDIVSAPALRMMNMARLYVETQNASEVAKAKVKAAVKTATKVQKPAAKGTPHAAGDKTDRAMAKLRKTGDVDDAADAFLATFADGDDD